MTPYHRPQMSKVVSKVAAQHRPPEGCATCTTGEPVESKEVPDGENSWTVATVLLRPRLHGNVNTKLSLCHTCESTASLIRCLGLTEAGVVGWAGAAEDHPRLSLTGAPTASGLNHGFAETDQGTTGGGRTARYG